MKIKIINKTVEQFCKEYTGEKFHALLCDPPYELGFMGKHWDRSGIVFNPETWAMLAQHLHPGAFGFSFASSRGWHRLACAIEDAGNVFHPSVFMAGWGFGSGFPKATRIDTQIEKAMGVKPKIIGKQGSNGYKSGGGSKKMGVSSNYTASAFTGNKIIASTDNSKTWKSHRYGLQALKPALEPILCWQRPYEGKAVDSITKTGAGALNVDDGRIEISNKDKEMYQYKYFDSNGNPYKTKASDIFGQVKAGEFMPNMQGRWPANLVLSHSPDCTPEKCVEGCAVKKINENISLTSDKEYNDRSKFFMNIDWYHEVLEQIADADPIKYQAKASRGERDAGCEELLKQRSVSMNQLCKNCGKVKLDGRRVGQCCDNPNYIDGQPNGNVRNGHPCIKPISLTQYLATLLLPPVEYFPRRILIPFSGSGSEIIGAMLAGWDEIVAVEMEPEYVEIAQARVAWWQNIYEKLGAQGVKDILEKFAKEEPEEVREAKKKQMDLF